MLFSYLLFSIIYGGLSGIAWALALNNEIKSNLLYGSIVGVIVGIND